MTRGGALQAVPDRDVLGLEREDRDQLGEESQHGDRRLFVVAGLAAFAGGALLAYFWLAGFFLRTRSPGGRSGS